jgi:phosphatidylserine decarboxylase
MIRHRYVGWLTVDRKTGEFKREQQPLSRKIRMLLLFNPLTEWIDETAGFRKYLHDKTVDSKIREEDPKTKDDIPGFIETYHIDMEQFEPSDWREYSSFQQFFVRHHKPGSRPIYAENDDTIAVVPADCRATVYDTVAETKQFWIKGRGWSIAKLIQDNDLAQTWTNGAVGCFRLSPQDYHRYHSPVSGVVEWDKFIPGTFFGVDPLAVSSSVDVLGENSRHCVCIRSKEFGRVLYVAVGAEDVGTIKFHERFTQKGSQVQKGEEVGVFEFGGSSILVAFESGRIRWDDDLVGWSRKSIMVDVEVGMQMGQIDRKE